MCGPHFAKQYHDELNCAESQIPYPPCASADNSPILIIIFWSTRITDLPRFYIWPHHAAGRGHDSISSLRPHCFIMSFPRWLLLRKCAPATSASARSLISRKLASRTFTNATRQPRIQCRNTRPFSSDSVRAALAQEPLPSPAEYTLDKVPKGLNLVDVKKVLVIGSGGLSIGQAGEFDYSG